MNIRTKSLLPVVATSIFVLSSCRETVPDRAMHYSLSQNKSFTEYRNVCQAETNSLQQAKLDSMAFRDVFNLSEAAKDSDKVAQFELIAQNMQHSFNEIDRILVENRIPKNEYNMDSFHLEKDINDKDEHFQYFADNWMYRNFFNKIGIMNDPRIKNACDRVSKIIKP